MNTPNKKYIFVGIAVILFIGLFLLGRTKKTQNPATKGNTNNSSAAKGVTSKSDMTFTTKSDPRSLIDLALLMQSDLGLKEVRISEIVGGIIEVRVKKPENVTKDTLSIATAYIFGYVEPYLSTGYRKYRVIYTVNDMDAAVYEASYADVYDWKKKQISDAEFAKTVKYINIGKK